MAGFHAGPCRFGGDRGIYDFFCPRVVFWACRTVSETIELPSKDVPDLSLLASAYDELDLPVGDTLVAQETSGPVVWLDGLGTSQGRHLINLGVRLLVYEDGVVRRYRQVRASVRYASGAGKQGVASRFAVSRRNDNPHLDIEESVLANGVVYKIPMHTTGLYRIDRDFLAALSDFPSPDAIDPDRVAIYGNGGAPVPALNSAPRLADLVEQPAYRSGGGDGSFDAGDAVVFYGKGPYGWTYGEEGWEHYVHPFSNENYYFVKILDEDAALPVSEPFPAYTGLETRSETEGRYMVDFDEYHVEQGERNRTHVGHDADPCRGLAAPDRKPDAAGTCAGSCSLSGAGGYPLQSRRHGALRIEWGVGGFSSGCEECAF